MIVVPTGPTAGETLLIAGVGKSVSVTPLLGTPFTVTTTLPVAAPVGTGAVTLVALHADGEPATPLNVIVLVPWAFPKLVPAAVTDPPTGAAVGLRLVILGVGSSVNIAPLLGTPFTITTTLPVVAATGTETVMLVELHCVGVANAPLK